MSLQWPPHSGLTLEMSGAKYNETQQVSIPRRTALPWALPKGLVLPLPVVFLESITSKAAATAEQPFVSGLLLIKKSVT